MNWIRLFCCFIAVLVVTTITAFSVGHLSHAQELKAPSKALQLVNALNATQWQELEEGLNAIRTKTENGVVITAFKISPENYEFSIELQNETSGSTAKNTGEQSGAVIAANAGFFAIDTSDRLFPIGYLRMNENVFSKGWKEDGGVLSFKEGTIELSPTHKGIPTGDFDAIQSKPMLIEPGGKWAMGSNAGLPKPRTLICTLETGEIILSTISRAGLTLFEAGWVLQSPEKGGFFGCDAALAFDGGRSTQIWYSGDERYSHSGISPVHNFFVVRQKED